MKLDFALLPCLSLWCISFSVSHAVFKVWPSFCPQFSGSNLYVSLSSDVFMSVLDTLIVCVHLSLSFQVMCLHFNIYFLGKHFSNHSSNHMTKHFKTKCIEQQPFHYKHSFCGSGIWSGHGEDGLSLLCDVWGSAGKTWRLGWLNDWGLDYLQAPLFAYMVPGLRWFTAELSWEWWRGLSMWIQFLTSWQPGSEWEHPEWEHLKRQCFKRTDRFKGKGHITHFSIGGVSKNVMLNFKTATVI